MAIDKCNVDCFTILWLGKGKIKDIVKKTFLKRSRGEIEWPDSKWLRFRRDVKFDKIVFSGSSSS